MTLKILFSLLLSAGAIAGPDCSPVNLITERNSPFLKIPVYDQQDSNICYAFSASQMLNYQLLKQGFTSLSVHPAWLALNYALGRNRKSLDIGHTKETIERLSEVNNCDYETVKDALLTWAGNINLPEATIVAFIEKFADARRAPASVDEAGAKMLTRLRKLASSPVNVMAQILLPACQRRQKIIVPKVTSFNFSQLPDDRAFEKFLIEKIGKASGPLSIAYCSKLWKKPDYDGIDLTFLGKRDSLKKDCEYHESLVVGKKLSQNSCHLLIRNTWGNGWKAGNKQWKCLCRDKVTLEFQDDCEVSTHPQERFSVEACWIPSEKISRNVGVVTITE